MARTNKYQRERAARIRRFAHDVICMLVKRGWKRGGRGRVRPTKVGPVDLWEALWTIDPDADHGVAPNVIAMLESRICQTTRMRHLLSGTKLLVRWCNAKGRTVDHVIALLREIVIGKKFPFYYRDYFGRLTIDGKAVP